MGKKIVSIKNEEIKVPKILCGILTGYERQNWVHPDLMVWVNSLRYNMEYAVILTKVHNFIPAAGARNTIARQVLKQMEKEPDIKPDWILMIDNDMAPPDNLLDTIKDAPMNAMVVVPKFHLWNGDNLLTNLCWGIDNAKTEEVDGVPAFRLTKKFIEIQKCGTGAIFIKPEVFKAIPGPWFEYKYDDNFNMIATEDIVFIDKVKAAGLKIYGNAAIEVAHHHTVDLTHINKIILNKKKSESSDKKEQKK